MWFEERRHGSSMRMVEDADPVVDLRTNEAYCKQHKNSSMTTLERALLDKTGMKWQRYQQLVQERLNENGFSAAASRFNKVCQFAKSANFGNMGRELAYLWNYFFVVSLGKGLPREVDPEANMLCGSHASLLDERYTTPQDMFMAQQSASGGGGGMMQEMMQSGMQQCQPAGQMQMGVSGMQMVGNSPAGPPMYLQPAASGYMAPIPQPAPQLGGPRSQCP